VKKHTEGDRRTLTVCRTIVQNHVVQKLDQIKKQRKKKGEKDREKIGLATVREQLTNKTKERSEKKKE